MATNLIRHIRFGISPYALWCARCGATVALQNILLINTLTNNASKMVGRMKCECKHGHLHWSHCLSQSPFILSFTFLAHFVRISCQIWYRQYCNILSILRRSLLLWAPSSVWLPALLWAGCRICFIFFACCMPVPYGKPVCGGRGEELFRALSCAENGQKV